MKIKRLNATICSDCLTVVEFLDSISGKRKSSNMKDAISHLKRSHDWSKKIFNGEDGKPTEIPEGKNSYSKNIELAEKMIYDSIEKCSSMISRLNEVPNEISDNAQRSANIVFYHLNEAFFSLAEEQNRIRKPQNKSK